jgi:magnesium-transporting ATPase (P-type)
MAERGSYDVDEHLLSPAEVAAKYGVDVNVDNPGQSKGLSSAQVKELQAIHGKNQLTPPAETPEWLKFCKQFTNPLMLLLVVAGGLAYMAYALQPVKDENNLILASALIIVVSATCVMSYWQERSASNVMASLSKMMPAKCTVVRNGVEQKVDATDLVPGDFVRLYIGDRIPADIRIIETYDLKVECSSLTGESDLVPASVTKKHDMAAEARNLVFMSSLAMNGEGRGIVVRTGQSRNELE